jgi:hypothetical protein
VKKANLLRYARPAFFTAGNYASAGRASQALHLGLFDPPLEVVIIVKRSKKTIQVYPWST